MHPLTTGRFNLIASYQPRFSMATSATGPKARGGDLVQSAAPWTYDLESMENNFLSPQKLPTTARLTTQRPPELSPAETD